MSSGQAIVHYRRKDGSDAQMTAEQGDDGGWHWTAPEDCEAITGFEFPPAGGGAIGHTAAVGTAQGYGGGG